MSEIIKLKQIGFFNSANAGLPIIPRLIPYGSEIVEVLTGGEVFFEHEGRVQKFSRGTIFWHIFGEATIWDTTIISPYKCVVFHFEVNGIKRRVPRISQWRGSGQSLEDFIRFSRSWFSASPQDPALFNYCLAELVAHAIAPEQASCSALPDIGSIPQKSCLPQLMIYIENNLAKNLDIETLCLTAAIGRNQLFREFKKYLKMTPHAYLLERKISRARRLLEETTLPIKEVSEQCGFENIEVFYRAFRQHTASSPGNYRRSHAMYDFGSVENIK